MALETIPTKDIGFAKDPSGNTLNPGERFSYGAEPSGDRYETGPGESMRYASPDSEPSRAYRNKKKTFGV